MEVKVTNEPIINLELTQTEAQWLKNLMQNPMPYDTIEDEAYRKKFFLALKETGVLL